MALSNHFATGIRGYEGRQVMIELTNSNTAREGVHGGILATVLRNPVQVLSYDDFGISVTAASGTNTGGGNLNEQTMFFLPWNNIAGIAYAPNLQTLQQRGAA